MHKVLHVIDSLTIGGAESVFLDLIERFKSEIGNHVLILRREKNDTFNFNIIKDNCDLYLLNRKNKFSIYKMYLVHNKSKNFNIIHVHLRHVYFYFYLTRFIFRGNYKLILHDHAGDDNALNKLSLIAKICKPDFYIAVSRNQIDWSISQWRIEVEKTQLLINLPNSNFKCKRFKYLSGDYLNCVCVGNIKPGKNQRFGVEIASKLNIKIDFIGFIQDEIYFESILREANGNSEFLSNVKVDSELLSEYDIGLFFSFSESGPLVLLEYIISGLPFIANKTGEIAEKLSNYFPEFFLDNFDIENWKKRIFKLKTMNWEAFDFEGRRSQLLKNEFQAEKYLSNVMGIYKRLS
jgi:glycosyltransferase involved in cell wall biosynthesis